MSFKVNIEHYQRSLFGVWNQIPESKRKMLENSKEAKFYDIVFTNIDEMLFSVLYNEKNGRPNAPVNTLVGAIILQNHNGWTCQELFNNLDFNILVRVALGIDTINESPFCPATFFNFQNRLLNHYNTTEENLLERVFDGLTESQIKELGLKTDICRSDSFQAMSNIAKYSRMQLLVEVLIRLNRILIEDDKKLFSEILEPYIKQESHHYLYNLKRGDIPAELDKIAIIYQKLYECLKDKYIETEVFKIFMRVYEEHFKVAGNQILIKASEELTSGCLQSPDDIAATYRLKKGKKFKGQVINICETANPENAINLINDVVVEKNNKDDSVILNDRIETIKDKNPDLNELHTDGAYGSVDNDKKMKELEINHIPTAVRGRSCEVEITIKQIDEGKYKVSCEGGQSVISTKARKKEKACFDNKICESCPFTDKCSTQKQKKSRVFYFTYEDCKKNERNRKIKELPPERRKIRPNIEATVKEFTKAFNHKGKLKVRGFFKTSLYATASAIGINFGRIFRYQAAFST